MYCLYNELHCHFLQKCIGFCNIFISKIPRYFITNIPPVQDKNKVFKAIISITETYTFLQEEDFALFSRRSKFQNAREIMIPGLLTFCILMVLFWMKGLAPFGTKSLVIFDADIQYLDFFCYFKDVLEGKNSIGYTFSKTLGGTNIAVFSYYLSSPFNLLLVFFKRTQLHSFFDLVAALKLSLASMTFSYFSRKRFEGSRSDTALVSTFLAVGYGLCQYNLAQSSNLMWLDGVYLLPLILLQISNIVSRKKAYALPFLVGLAILFNWYSAGIDCVYSAFWFLFESALYAIDEKFNWKHFLSCAVKYLAGMLAGVLLSSALFFPTFAALKKSTRGSLHFEELINFSFIGELPSVIQKYTYGAKSEYGSVALFCGSLALLLAIFTIFNRQMAVRKRALFAGLLTWSVLIFYLSPFFTMFSLFQWVFSYHYRYSYVAAFSILFLAQVGAKELNSKIQARTLLRIAVTFSGLLVLLQYCRNVNDNNYVYATAIVMLLEAAVYIHFQFKMGNKFGRLFFTAIFAITATVDLAANAGLLLDAYSVDEVTQNNAYIETQGNTIAAIQTADPSWYRISQTTTRNMGADHLTAYYNEGLAYHYASISGYTSSPDDIQRNFLDKLGYRICGENMCITNTSILGADSLLGVKYVLSPYAMQGLTKLSENDSNGKAIYRNPYAFPMAFVYKDSDYERKDAANPFEYQNELYKQLFGITEDLYEPIEYDITYGEGNCGATITLEMPDASDTVVYGNIPWDHEAESSISINGSFATKYACWLSPTVFYIPGTEEPTCEVEVQSNEDNFLWDSVQFYALKLDVLSRCAEMANDGAVHNLSVQNGQVDLCVDAEEGERLFLSIPSDEDWAITVNGTAAETDLIGDCLYSIKLHPGTNEISMLYHVRYLKLGILLTVLTLLACIAYTRYRKRRPC